MRKLFVLAVVMLGWIQAFATGYTTGPVAGFMTWNSAWSVDYWTPRLPTHWHEGADPNMWPGTFTGSTLSVTCNPACTIGSTFSVDLAITNFTSGLGALTGRMDLLSAPIVIKAASGIAIAHFNLNGTLGYGSNVILDVDVHGFATFAYNVSSGRLAVSSISYALPEPSSFLLAAVGALAMGRAWIPRRKYA